MPKLKTDEEQSVDVENMQKGMTSQNAHAGELKLALSDTLSAGRGLEWGGSPKKFMVKKTKGK